MILPASGLLACQTEGEGKMQEPDIIAEKVLNILNNKNNLININTASIQELDALPGVGEATANKIVNYREEKGKFNSIEQKNILTL